MAARPNPERALAACQRVARTSERRLEAMIESCQVALDTNSRLRKADQAYYVACIAAAHAMLAELSLLTHVRLPAAPRDAPAKLGRPTNAERERWKKQRS